MYQKNVNVHLENKTLLYFFMNKVNRESEKMFIRNNYAAKVSNIGKNNIKPKSSSRHVENARLFPLKLLILENKRTG